MLPVGYLLALSEHPILGNTKFPPGSGDDDNFIFVHVMVYSVSSNRDSPDSASVPAEGVKVILTAVAAPTRHEGALLELDSKKPAGYTRVRAWFVSVLYLNSSVTVTSELTTRCKDCGPNVTRKSPTSPHSSCCPPTRDGPRMVNMTTKKTTRDAFPCRADKRALGRREWITEKKAPLERDVAVCDGMQP
jgi:hypothetical protein